MGGARLRGWLAQGLAPDRLTVIDPALPELPAGVRSLNALPDDEAGPEVLVLAVKPQLLGDVVAQFRRKSDCAPGLLLSVLAGVESGVLKQAFNAGATVRAMPNLPAQSGQGVTVLCSEDADLDRRHIAQALMLMHGGVELSADEELDHSGAAP